MTNCFHNRRRGFAMLAALGVMAVLMMIVIAAANCVDLTYSLNEMRAADKQISDAVRQAAALLAGPDRAELAKPGQTIVIIPAVTTASSDVEVSATIGIKIETPLSSRDGDLGVLLSAARKSGRGTFRKATCLFNAKGARQAPILLSEERR